MSLLEGGKVNRLLSIMLVGSVILLAIPVMSCNIISETAETQSNQIEQLSYEVVSKYTDNIVIHPIHIGYEIRGYVIAPKACVEIKNTGNIARLFSIHFNFSEEFFGQDLIYLEPDETGVATYTAEMTMDSLGNYYEQTDEWQYEITPVVLN